MVSVHRPPKRYDRLWGAFDRNLAKFVKSSKTPIVIGMDANQVNPQRMARATGLKWHAPKGSIDGFLATPGIKFSHMHRLPNRHSDHYPVIADISIPKKLSK
jgi:endonuclease/exonuclease/phosphatase family metal-dependent hydrolase